MIALVSLGEGSRTIKNGSAITKKAPRKLGSSQVDTRRFWCGSQPTLKLRLASQPGKLSRLGMNSSWRKPRRARTIIVVINPRMAKALV